MSIMQHFSLPAGDSITVKFNLGESEESISLHAAQSITWKVWKQLHGVVDDGDPIISKALNEGITPVESPVSFNVDLESEDTQDLLGSYYHEAVVITSLGEVITVTQGLMTVTEAK